MSWRETLRSDPQKVETWNWADLPPEITFMILLKLEAVDILENAQWVCTQWWRICKDPRMWRTIHMRFSPAIGLRQFENMCYHAIIHRTCGYLLDLTLEIFGTDELLNSIVDSLGHLRRLRLVCCIAISDKALCEVAKKLPWLEELDILISKREVRRKITKAALLTIGQCCPLLKSLRFNRQAYSRHSFRWNDGDAFAIAKTMPKLQLLQLFGNSLTDVGLLAILDGCPHLQSLDLRKCYNITLGGDLGRRCAEQVKDLWCPFQSTCDDQFDAEFTVVDDDRTISRKDRLYDNFSY